jgi:hypothetical protein
MKFLETVNQQVLEREIALRSRRQRYYTKHFTQSDIHRILDLFFDITEEVLSLPTGKISLHRLGVFEVCPRSIGGALKQGNGAAEAISHKTFSICFRPAGHIKAKLKANCKYVL